MTTKMPTPLPANMQPPEPPPPPPLPPGMMSLDRLAAQADAAIAAANSERDEMRAKWADAEARCVTLKRTERELAAYKRTIAEVIAGWDEVAKREGTKSITGVPGSERLRELLAANYK